MPPAKPAPEDETDSANNNMPNGKQTADHADSPAKPGNGHLIPRAHISQSPVEVLHKNESTSTENACSNPTAAILFSPIVMPPQGLPPPPPPFPDAKSPPTPPPGPSTPTPPLSSIRPPPVDRPRTPKPSSRKFPRTADFFTKYLHELEKFKKRQDYVTTLRVQLRGKREALRKARDAVSNRDMDLMNALRVFMANDAHGDLTKLNTLQDFCSQARDAIGPVEAEFNSLELELGSAEFALEQWVDELQEIFDIGTTEAITATSGRHDREEEDIEYEPNNGDEAVRGDSTDLERAYSTAIVFGDEIDVGERPILNSTGHLRSASLRKAPSTGSPAVRSSHIHILESRRVTNQENIGSDIDSAAPELASGASWLALKAPRPVDKRTASLEALGERHRIRYSEDKNEDALLLLGDDNDTRSILSDLVLNFTSTESRVEQWLQHKLRLSPLEAFHLRQRVMEATNGVDDWAELAVKLWESDAAPLPPASEPSAGDNSKYVSTSRQRSPISFPPTIESNKTELAKAIKASFQAIPFRQGRKRRKIKFISRNPSVPASAPGLLDH